jgi:hypothetical protein
MTRRHESALGLCLPGEPWTDEIDRFMADTPPRTVAEGLRLIHYERHFPRCAPGHADLLVQHMAKPKDA